MFKLWIVFLGKIVLLFLLGLFLACSDKEPDTPEPEPDKKPEIVLEGNLKTLRLAHPRLLMTEERLAELKTLSNSDSRLQKYVADVIGRANNDLVKPPIQHVLIGPRLLDKSQECLKRIYSLAFAYRWTNDIKYLNAAVDNMRNVCSFPDWNPSHFLDVAEMTHAVAIGYDWLFPALASSVRDEIKAGLIKHGLNEGKKGYASKAWWATAIHNWNQVCNSGLLIGALAIAETDQQLARDILDNAILNLPLALVNYGPDGVWGEGPGYWNYASDYTAYGLAALLSALGKDFGMTNTPGLNLTGYFPMYSTGPTGLVLNYADAGEKSKLATPHPNMWLAKVYNNTHFSDYLMNQLMTNTANALDVVWFRSYSGSSANLSLDKYLGGQVALFFSRSSWTDSKALWVGIKAGFNKVNHAHLDLGNFEMDALGVRWVRDLGSDDYNLPDYFSGSTQTSKRWTYYRLGSHSHNVPLLNEKNQSIDGTSQFIKHAEGVNEPFGVIDFTTAYAEFASSAIRGMKVINGRKSVLVQDEFNLTKPCSITWGITTDATIELLNTKQARLSLGGQVMTATILSPGNAVFETASAEQSPPQKVNTGVWRLLAKTPIQSGKVTVAVLLSPHWPYSDPLVSYDIKTLNEW